MVMNFEAAIWIKVHPTAASDVKPSIKKFDWLRGRLKSDLGQLAVHGLKMLVKELALP